MAITKGICYRHLDGLTDEEFDALEKEISGVIDTLDNDDFSDIYQEYAIYNHYPRVYSNCDYVINDMLSWSSPWQIAKKAHMHYSPEHKYVRTDENGNLYSSDDVRDLANASPEALASFVIENACDYFISEIAEVMDKYDDIGREREE